jgi:hypothetical protein
MIAKIDYRRRRFRWIVGRGAVYVKLGISIVRQLTTRRPNGGIDERHAMIDACRSAARSDFTDQCAVEELRDTLRYNNVYAEQVVNALGQKRYSYVDDRAFRLAEAALSGNAVQAMYSGQRRLFEEEEKLGRMPIEAAFEWLVRIVPELDEVRRTVRSQGGPIVPGFKEVDKLLGPNSHSSDDLARTRLATLVSMEYLRVLAGDIRRGDMSTPYFVSVERPMRTVLIDRRKSVRR